MQKRIDLNRKKPPQGGFFRCHDWETSSALLIGRLGHIRGFVDVDQVFRR
jgi:hypothetical protein